MSAIDDKRKNPSSILVTLSPFYSPYLVRIFVQNHNLPRSLCDSTSRILMRRRFRRFSRARRHEFLSFNNNTAQDVWDLYVNKPANLEVDFFNSNTWHIEHHSTDVTSRLDDWDKFMIDFAINPKVRLVILLPEFSDVRYTAARKSWLLDAI